MFYIFIGVKNSYVIPINRGMIFEDIFHKETQQGRFDWGTENKGVLSFWLSQMLDTKNIILQIDLFTRT